jgi:hypothetical protein
MSIEEDRKFVFKKNAVNTTSNQQIDEKKEVEYYYDYVIKNIISMPFFATIFSSNPEFYDDLRESVELAVREKNNKQASSEQTSDKKFVKTAIFGLPGMGVPVPGLSGFPGLGSLFGSGAGLDKQKIISELLSGDYQGAWEEICKGLGAPPLVEALGKYVIPRIQRVIQQMFNPEMIRRTYILDTMKEFGKKRQKYEYSPSAFKHLLDQKGYNDEEQAQGAYDVRGKELTDEIEKYKKSNPDKFKHEYSYYDDPDVQEKLNKTSSTKFKKLAQSRPTRFTQFQRTKETDKIYNSLKELLPNWDIQTLKNEMMKVASRQDLNDEQKSQLMLQTIDPYIKSVAPLHEYISKMRSER